MRDKLLREHNWPCIRKQTILSPATVGPQFDWGYRFLLPSDWLRTIQVGQRGHLPRFEQVGRYIHADTNTLHLLYAWRNDDPVLWDSQLRDLASAEMVARLAYPITQSASLAELKRREADAQLRVAKSIASQDNEPEDWGDSPFIDVRG